MSFFSLMWRSSVAFAYLCARARAVPRPLAGRTRQLTRPPARPRPREADRDAGHRRRRALDEGGAIAAIEPRRGTIVRRAPGPTTAGHVLAANVDLAIVTEPLPDPKARRLERFAALAASGGVQVALALTKADLDEEAQVAATRLGRRLGVVDAIAVSAVTGEGMGILRHLLTPGTTSVLLGASGTGKSTLVNALLGEERQKTGEVRASDRRGRHTTVTRELLTLPNGAHLIDTPGIRIAGLWDGTGESFADVDELALQCRFPDCAHDTEPGCAVRDVLDPSGSPPGASCSASWRGWRTGAPPSASGPSGTRRSRASCGARAR